jgi:protoheme IX farnesyltransferase
MGYKLLKECYWLTKPGIIYGNALTAIGGFLLAAQWHIDLLLFVATIAGTCLVIASACVINNYVDRGIDQKMARTKWREATVRKLGRNRMIAYGATLGLLGFGLLIAFTNWVVVAIGLVAYIDYIVLYGVTKRISVHGTLVGSIAGAAPPVAGYCAVTGRFDGGALIIFLIMVCWQMVHFYAIAIRRASEYKAAKIPVLPLVKGVEATKIQMITYTVAFIISVAALAAFGYAGWVFAVVMTALGIYWLYRGLKSFNIPDDVLWAKQMFGYSLVVLLSFSVMMSVGSTLP